jgi:hypothetical protein
MQLRVTLKFLREGEVVVILGGLCLVTPPVKIILI